MLGQLKNVDNPRARRNKTYLVQHFDREQLEAFDGADFFITKASSSMKKESER